MNPCSQLDKQGRILARAAAELQDGIKVLIRESLGHHLPIKITRQIAIGIVIGTVVAGGMLQGMQGGKGDPQGFLVLLGVAVFMSGVGVAAAIGPARRALRIQPTEALRTD